MKKSILFSLAVVIMIPMASQAQVIKMVDDIHPTGSSYPHFLTGFRSGMLPSLTFEVIFVAKNDDNPYKLWITDGTSAGTRLVKDIYPGGNAVIQDLTYSGNILVPKVYFSAIDETHGRELWVTGGTEASTRLVADINPGVASSISDDFAILNGKLIFTANNGTSGFELYISDGTESGTRLLMDIYPGAESSSPREMKTIDGKVWFSANDGTHGRELWVTDGTTVNTALLKDINTRTSDDIDSDPANFIAMSGKVFFTTFDEYNGTQLYTSDGTTAGTRLVKKIGNILDSRPNDFIVLNHNLFFWAYETALHRPMFSSDGTEEGTGIFLAEDQVSAQPLMVFNNRLYFDKWTEAYGSELWSTDGTGGGTFMVRDINNGPGNAYPGSYGIAVLNNLLYFTASNNNENNFQMWVTDGTSEGTRMIMPEVVTNDDPLLNTDPFLVWNNILYFSANYTSHGWELWKVVPPATGIEEFRANVPEFNFWPNPARGELQINCSHPVTIRILDLTGRALIEKTILQSGTLSLGGLSPGVYFISDTGNKTVRKLVVE